MNLTGPLLLKVGFLLAVALIVATWVWAVRYGREHGTLACDRKPGVVSVRVPASTVSYAERQGWRRVLVVGDPLGSPWAYDHAREVRPVRRGTDGLCQGQRFRLRARR